MKTIYKVLSMNCHQDEEFFFVNKRLAIRFLVKTMKERENHQPLVLCGSTHGRSRYFEGVFSPTIQGKAHACRKRRDEAIIQAVSGHIENFG